MAVKDASAQLKNDDSRAVLRGKPQDLGKIVIQRDESSTFRAGDCEDRLIVCPRQAFITSGDRIMAGAAEEFDTASADVFVKLELHATSSAAIGITRSRAASAP